MRRVEKKITFFSTAYRNISEFEWKLSAL